MGFRRLLLAVAATTCQWRFAAAVPGALPAPTAAIHNAFLLNGWTPVPTSAPIVNLVNRDSGVGRRQVSSSSAELIGYFGPDATCGFDNGQLGAPITCASGQKCAAIAPIGTVPGAVGCCQLEQESCYFLTGCYDLAAVQASSCDHACQINSNNLICTSSSSTHCYGYTWPDISATFWRCDTTTASTKDTVSFSFLGEADSRSWSAAYYTGGTSSNPLTTPSSTLSSSLSSTTTVSPPATSTQAAKSTNEGPIIGGTLAGVAILGITALGIALIFVRRRRQYGPPPAELSAQSAPPPRMQQYQSPTDFYGPDRESEGSGLPAQSPPLQYAQTSPNQYADQQASSVSSGSGAVHMYQAMPTIPQSPAELDATPTAPNSHAHPAWSPDE